MAIKTLQFRSIRVRFMILSTILIVTLFGGLGVFITSQNSAEIKKLIDLKATAIADLSSQTGAVYMSKQSYLALDNLVEDIKKDRDVSFAGFYDDKNELLTRSTVPENTSSFIVVERKIQLAEESAALGTMKIGFKKDSITKSIRRSVLVVALGTLLAITLFSIGIIIAANRIILKPLDSIRRVIGYVASGDLSKNIEVTSNDELGALASALNEMTTNLNQMVGKVNNATAELNSITVNLLGATGQVVNSARMQSDGVISTSSSISQINVSIRGVNDSVNGLSQVAAESASSILEMTASVEEVALNSENLSVSVNDVSSSINQMAASIKQVNSSVRNLTEVANNTASSVMEMDYSIRQVEKSASDAAFIYDDVRKDAEAGREALEESIAGIHEIKNSSGIIFDAINNLSEKTADIGAIISVIDDVAGQTNLLALNAAIIAAQAGDHGKGFAVVADEIKQLADRTRTSTREIAGVINAVQEETARAVEAIQIAGKSINRGESLADRSSEAFDKIFHGVEKTTTQMKEIARATLEQTKGSQQIRDAVEQVSQMVARIDSATMEQAQGSDLIIASSERMKEITSQVKNATKEQSEVGKFIATSTEAITGMIEQIRRASNEQSRGSDMISESVDDIQTSAAINLEATKVMDDSVASLFGQIEALKKEMQAFRV